MKLYENNHNLGSNSLMNSYNVTCPDFFLSNLRNKPDQIY